VKRKGQISIFVLESLNGLPSPHPSPLPSPKPPPPITCMYVKIKALKNGFHLSCSKGRESAEHPAIKSTVRKKEEMAG